MTAEFRDFDAEELEPLPPAGEFQLGGRRWRVRHPDDVETGKLISVGKVEGDSLLFPLGDFFAETLVPDDAKDFAKLLSEPPPTVTKRKVQAAMTYVYELLSGFPTKPGSGSSSTSSSARPRKAKSSAARSSSQGTRRRASGG